MLFNVKCSAFVRLAAICDFFEATTDEETRIQLNTVRLENLNGKTYAIACNHKIAAVELVNTDPSLVNGVAHVILDQVIVQQCQAESFFDSVLTINTVPEIALATAVTTSGWQFSGNACHWFSETVLDDWRNWAPDAPVTENKGIMMWNLFHIEALLKSSPSGKIYFPEHIDSKKPVVLRDRENPNWVGLFVPKPHADEVKIPAQLPAWWRA